MNRRDPAGPGGHLGQLPGSLEFSGSLGKVLTPEGRRAFSVIYGNLVTGRIADPPSSVLVCGVTGQEGASTVAVGLALAAASQSTGKVLLIDGNWHNPTISQAFGLTSEPGFGDYLTGSMEAHDLIRPTPDPNLWVLCAGTTHRDERRRFEAAKLLGLFVDLLAAYQFIVLDGPAINPYPESALFASMMSRVLVVLHAGVTRGPVVQAALAKLTLGQPEAIELILNRRTFAIPEALYRRL